MSHASSSAVAKTGGRHHQSFMPNPLSRRAALKAAAAFTASLSLGLRRAHAASEIADAAQKAHDQIWHRFIDEHDILIDYADFDGSFPRPTAEECLQGKPNALGWWTPTENGSMFNGLYVDAAVNRWKLSHAEADKEKARPRACSWSTVPCTVSHGMPNGWRCMRMLSRSAEPNRAPPHPRKAASRFAPRAWAFMASIGSRGRVPRASSVFAPSGK